MITTLISGGTAEPSQRKNASHSFVAYYYGNARILKVANSKNIADRWAVVAVGIAVGKGEAGGGVAVSFG